MSNKPKSQSIIVGKLSEKIYNILNLNFSNKEENIYMYPGFIKHVTIKHSNCLEYIKFVSDIINDPDYVGVNPNESDSLEFVKIFDKNILLAVKLSKKTNLVESEEYLFTSSLYDITESKLNNRINSERLKKV